MLLLELMETIETIRDELAIEGSDISEGGEGEPGGVDGSSDQWTNWNGLAAGDEANGSGDRLQWRSVVQVSLLLTKVSKISDKLQTANLEPANYYFANQNASQILRTYV